MLPSLLFIALPFTASAEQMDRRFYIAPGLNYNYLDKAQDVDSDSGFQLSIGKHLTEHFNLELFGTSWEASDDDAQGEFDALGLNLMYLFQRDDLTPYGLLGVMATDYDLTRNGVTTDESGTAVDLGFGVFQQIARHGTALRWEYKHRFNQAETEDFNDDIISLALHIPLGAAPGIPAPPAPPPAKPPQAKPKTLAPPPEPKPAPAPPKPAIVLQGVHFDFDSAKLKPEAQKILSNAAVTLKNYPEIRAIAIGHTCNIGTEEYNDQLSLARAQSVKDFLVARGVAAERLVVRGYGETLPVADNSTIEGRKRNRRVEISVINENLCLPPHEGEPTDENGCARVE